MTKITITGPEMTVPTLDVTVTMNQAFALSEMIFALDEDSYDYKELRELGKELLTRARQLHK